MQVTGEKLLGFRERAVLAVCVATVLCLAMVQPAFAQNTADQYQGDGCIPITTLQGNTSKETEPFGIGNTTLRVVYETQPANNQGFNFTIISVTDARNFTTIDSTVARDGRDGVLRVPLEAGRYTVDANTSEQSYDITVEAEGGTEPCTGEGQDNGDEDDNNEDPGDPSDPGDVDKGTIPDKPLPDTGGLPLAGLVVIGLALVGIGGSIVRAGVERRS